MKKQPTISTKGTNKKNVSANSETIILPENAHKNTVYRTAKVSECEDVLCGLIMNHYASKAYYTAIGSIFTQNELRPEFNVDYSRLIASILRVGDKEQVISDILNQCTPKFLNLKDYASMVLFNIKQQVLGDKDLCVCFDHVSIREVMFNYCVYTNSLWNIDSLKLFGDKHSALQCNETMGCSLSSGALFNFILFGLNCIKNDHEPTEMLCNIGDSINPFTSKDITAELDEAIDHISFSIKAFHEFYPDRNKNQGAIEAQKKDLRLN